MINQHETDWNLVTQAQISISWLFQSTKTNDQNVQGALKAFTEEHEGCDIINPGILMAYAYICFVYPRETAIKSIDDKRLDFSKFNITIGQNKDVLRRLRNSIAHGRFSISSDAKITFTDNRKDGKDPFCAEISCGDLGSFVQSLCYEIKRRYLHRQISGFTNPQL